MFVLSIDSRLLEKIIFDRIFPYFTKNEFLFSDQSGFRQCDSVLTCVIKCTNVWHIDFDRGHFSGVIFIDLKKAVDIVDHESPIARLCVYRVEGVEFDWFAAYRGERKQCCNVDGKISKIEEVKCGVCQGSCLGPLLFLTYINDLPFALQRTKATMYADDTSTCYSSKSVIDLAYSINSDLQDPSLWLQGNKSTLNAAKTHSIIFGTKPKLSRYLCKFSSFPNK